MIANYAIFPMIPPSLAATIDIATPVALEKKVYKIVCNFK
jgi:hypothetical protein